MKSLKSHISLIIALFSILLTLQIFQSLDRVIHAYEKELGDNYAIVVVSDTNMSLTDFQRIDSDIKSAEPISPKKMLQTLQRQIHTDRINLMELELPYFYRLRLDHFATPEKTRILGLKLESNQAIGRVETFSQQHDTIYRLLQLFKWVMTLLAGVLLLVTSLLIIKEMRLWQFQHRERMNIMALFGAPVWLRSAVLFRLAIVDAIVASLLAATTFMVAEVYGWTDRMLALIDISVNLFDPLGDLPILFSVAITLSIVLAAVIMMGHKEEV